MNSKAFEFIMFALWATSAILSVRNGNALAAACFGACAGLRLARVIELVALRLAIKSEVAR